MHDASQPTSPYGGPLTFSREERQAWVRGYLWALENIDTTAVQTDLRVMRTIRIPGQRVRPANFCACVPTCETKAEAV